jgi:hypothetical protein
VSDPLRFFAEPRLERAPLVIAFEGWNDAHEAASYALRHLRDSFRCVPLATIDCEEFLDFTVRRPETRALAEGGRGIEWPNLRFHLGSLDAERELVTGLGAEPHLRWRAFCDVIAELVQRLGLREIVMLGAYLADVVYSRPVAITAHASDPRRLEAIGVAPSAYKGPVGILGVLHERLQREGVSVISLWAGLPHYIHTAPNARGALALLEALASCLTLELDLEKLRREASEFEEKSSALVTGDPELAGYVRELKKRDFAQ